MNAAQMSPVFAVQCPNPKCRKFMLVEESDRNKVVPCLLCKTPIRVGAGSVISALERLQCR